jgi:hypothetical protein
MTKVYSASRIPKKLLALLSPSENMRVDYRVGPLQNVNTKRYSPDSNEGGSTGNYPHTTVYPTQDLLHVSTDGSVTDKRGNAGAGIHCKLFSFYLTLGQHATHCDGQLSAIHISLTQQFIKNGSFKKLWY